MTASHKLTSTQVASGELTRVIADEINRRGPISFEDFMSLALYHPELGYYCSPKEKLGFGGDFYTSCTLTPAFGHSIAAQLLEMWQMSGITDFTIVEYGAGTGDFCASILSFFEVQSTLPGKLSYYIIEISSTLRELQQKKVPVNVKWINSIEEIAGFSGVVLSNELIDNFPVRRVEMKETLKEIRVDYDGGFREVLVPADEELNGYFSDLRVVLPYGFKTEVCLRARSWMESIARSIKQGFVMTIDYGYLSGDLYSSSRSGGTVVSYFNHKVIEDLYANVGKQDISAHVNFSALALFGMHNGLLLTGFREQGPFLTALKFERRLVEQRANGDVVAATRNENAVMQIILGDMGKKFKVLVQHKGLPQFKLTGFMVSER